MATTAVGGAAAAEVATLRALSRNVEAKKCLVVVAMKETAAATAAATTAATAAATAAATQRLSHILHHQRQRRAYSSSSSIPRRGSQLSSRSVVVAFDSAAAAAAVSGGGRRGRRCFKAAICNKKGLDGSDDEEVAEATASALPIVGAAIPSSHPLPPPSVAAAAALSPSFLPSLHRHTTSSSSFTSSSLSNPFRKSSFESRRTTAALASTSVSSSLATASSVSLSGCFSPSSSSTLLCVSPRSSSLLTSSFLPFLSSSSPPSTSSSLSFTSPSSPVSPSSNSFFPSALGGTSRRHYSNLGGGWSLKKKQYTKYRISKPWTTDSRFDDLLLSEPSRDDFVRHSKDIPLFLRFLKLVTDVENRPAAFKEFAKRCENGLVVEKDVYITKKQLMDCVWQNGYSEAELNAFEIAFPPDYHFHYPELAVLFDVSEEDAYKYCLRQRAANPEELVELKYKPPQNLVASYALVFLGVWFGLSNTVLSNAWFYSKTFPFGAVFYLLGSHFYRDIREYFWKTERAQVQTARENKETGEDLICKQITKYSNDSRCLEYLSAFKDEVQQQVTKYRRALITFHKAKATEQMLARLAALQSAERQIQSSLQEMMVAEIVSSFRSAFANSDKLKSEAVKSAILGIAGKESKDVVAEHFKSSLKEFRGIDFGDTTKTASGSPVVQRLALAFREQRSAFLDQFTVRPEEAAEVKSLTAKCKTKSNDIGENDVDRKGKGSATTTTKTIYDFSKLSKADLQRLDSLCFLLSSRLGLEPLDESSLAAIPPPIFEAAATASAAVGAGGGGGGGVASRSSEEGNGAAAGVTGNEANNNNNNDDDDDRKNKTAAAVNAFLDGVNGQLREAATRLRDARLTTFARAFE